MSRAFSTEAEMAANVVEWLRKAGWRVGQEVQVKGYERELGVVDILAHKEGRWWAIQCKLSLSFAVVGQAARWAQGRGYAHRISVAVPAPEDVAGWDFALSVVAERGIGLLAVTPGNVTEMLPAKYHAGPEAVGLEILPQHETYAPAGNAEGKRYTPRIERNDGLRAQLVKAVCDHVGNGRRSLAKYCKQVTDNPSLQSELSRWAKAHPELIHTEYVSGVWLASAPRVEAEVSA